MSAACSNCGEPTTYSKGAKLFGDKLRCVHCQAQDDAYEWRLAKPVPGFKVLDVYEIAAESFKAGAAVAFGLIGMAEAIRDRERERPNRDLARWYDQHLAEQAAFSAAHMQYAQNAAAGIAQHVNAQALANNCTRGEDLFASIVRDSWLTGRKK